MSTTTKKNNPPLRRCLVSGESLPKSDLLRLVRTPQGQLMIDVTGRANGRGAYMKKDPTLIGKLIKLKLLEKALHVVPDSAFIQELEKLLHG